MLETRAKIIKIEGLSAVVQVNQVSSCEQCQGRGCGSSKVGQLFCSSPQQFLLENPIHAKLGDEVILSVAETVLLRSVAVMYLLPIFSLILGAALPAYFGVSPDSASAFGAIAGLGVGFAAVKFISAKLAQQKQPYIARLCIEE
ncbi:MAG: SoxR reducing system RseC family protein [Gallionella sp.]